MSHDDDDDTTSPGASRGEALDARALAAIARFRPSDGLAARLVIGSTVVTSRWIMTRRNRTTIEGLETFLAAKRRGGRGLLTFANHVSLLDDPLLVSCLPLGPPREVRWTAADAFNFFGDPVRGAFFGAGRCVPIVRGAGEDQPGFAFLRERLLAGDWVHIFPEGGRTRDPDGWMRPRLKTGIGRLIDETRPLALPFYHHGMHRVLPVGARVPARGQHVQLRFGEIVDCDDSFVAATARGRSGRACWEALAGWAFGVLRGLERDVRGDDDDRREAPSRSA